MKNKFSHYSCAIRFVGWLIIITSFSCTQKQTVFRLVPNGNSGITFSNNIVDSGALNIVNYEYLYNGAGVAVGDFNNDGFADIYFAGNMVSNEMYLNKGNFVFDNITTQSKTSGDNRWSKGVAVVDINNDGLLDLYVCAAVKKEGKDRANLLYVCQGIDPVSHVPVYNDMAKEYGLDDTSHTQMASFFDYDNDGDLDVFLLVNELKENNPNEYRQSSNSPPQNVDKLYENLGADSLGHPFYKDVSQSAGISEDGYGLGVITADINHDGWIDIYVSNDFLSNDLWYMNNGDKTFTNKINAVVKHTARNGMGMDIADINNDTLADIIQLDMAPADNQRAKLMFNPMNYSAYQNYERYGYMHQYPRNMLQLNRGIRNDSSSLPVFSEIAYYAGIAHTDWSWSSLAVDVNNDQWKDILITNGLPKDMSDLDFMTYRDQAKNILPTDEILKQLPEVKLPNFAFLNNKDLTFTDKSIDWGWGQPSTSSGMATADFDNDGDIDVVINNTNMPAFLYENNTRKLNPDSSHFIKIKLEGNQNNKDALGSSVKIFSEANMQVEQLNPYRGYLSSIQNNIHAGLGYNSIVDSIIIQWAGGFQQVIKNLKADSIYTFKLTTGNENTAVFRTSKNEFFQELPNFLFPSDTIEEDYIDFSDQRLIPHKLSQAGPGLAAGDINGDGLEDMIAGGYSGKPATIYLQLPNGKFLNRKIALSHVEAKGDDLGICLFDADNDNDADLYIAVGGNEFSYGNPAYRDRFFRNDGNGNFSEDSTAIPLNLESNIAVKSADINNDGFADLFVGSRVKSGQYPLPCSGYIYLNDGKGNFKDVSGTWAPALSKIGMITDATWTDFDNDNDPDLFVVGEWMAPVLFVNNGKQLEKFSDGFPGDKGWYNSINAGDLDNDGDIDYVLGNYGMNGFLQMTPKYPIGIYASDYERNNTFDAILTSWFPSSIQGERKEYPVAGREDMIREMFFIRRRFPYYKNYANATIDSLFTKEERHNEYSLKANFGYTSWMENQGNSTFKFHLLPAETQFSPVFGTAVLDINDDGNLDIITVGNDYGMAPYLGRNDAGYGLVMLGDGKGDFKSLSINNSGFFIPGDAKGLISMEIAKRRTILVTQNRGPIKAFSLKGNQSFLEPSKTDVAAIVTLTSGGKTKTEFYYGNSYISQSSRKFYIPAEAVKVEFIDRLGKSKEVFKK